MRFIKLVPSSRRKNRKNHFMVSFHVRRRLISGPLSKDLRQKYNVRSMSKSKDGEVQVITDYGISCSMEKLEYKRLFVDVTKANKLIKLLKCIERRMLSLKAVGLSTACFTIDEIKTEWRIHATQMKYVVFPLIMDDPYIKVAYIVFKGTYTAYSLGNFLLLLRIVPNDVLCFANNFVASHMLVEKFHHNMSPTSSKWFN
ncbi:hypothetical protein HZH66_014031 [Vespula vulgaris]|uniref:Uncharacterized protein n=1 Tax=Vespula vulgaris TaxID=7454 RepID=A0A834J545_VESVU|nr:hypothetical protein HZH66_014031 [Vespula vulgaris]